MSDPSGDRREDESSQSRHFKRVALGVCLVAALYLGFVASSGLGFNPTGVAWEFEAVGQLGDSFGPLNTFMAGLAAVGALGAYLAQRDELSDARISAKAEKKLAEKRDFEATYFRLIELLRDTTKEIEVTDQYNQNPVRGRDAIKRIVEEKIGRTFGNDESDRKNYNEVYLRNRDDLGHYFRTIYHIVRLIDEVGVEEKVLYIRLLRASLSNSEVVLLALNCVYGEGREKFKPLIDRHALLHNISEEDARNWRLTEKFADGAFGDRPQMISRLKASNEDLSGAE